MGKTGEKRGKKCLFFHFIGWHGCTRRNSCFQVGNYHHADQKHLTRRKTFDLDIKSTHDQPASCRARPVKVDGGLEDIRRIRSPGGERLPAASYALFPNLEKSLVFCHRRGIEIFGRLFSTGTQQRPTVFVLDAWPAPARYHWPCEHCDQRVGRAPNERSPFRFLDAVVGFCRSMSVENSEARRFEVTVWLSFA